MSEVLFEVAGFSVTVTIVYGIISALVLFLFTALWLVGKKKRTRADLFAGQVMNGIGFGILPALAVLKAFQEAGTGAGSKVLEPLPCVKWLSVAGNYMPGRIETAAAAAAFLMLCLWLVIRRKELPDNGDLIMVSVSVWAAIRLVTEDFRTEPAFLFRCTSCVTILFCAVVWSVRRVQRVRVPGRTVTELGAVCVCIAVNLVTAAKLLTVGSAVADFFVKTGSAFLMLMLTLMIGGDLRRIIQKNDPAKQAAVPGDTLVVQRM
ncbi:MAG: hypothetical protein ABS897_10985 [Eubacteriales bacterium]